MVWTIEYTDSAKSILKKLDKQTAKLILDYMDERISVLEDPHSSGKALTGSMGGLWRYCVGDFRVICEIQNNTLRVLVLSIGNRRDVYK